MHAFLKDKLPNGTGVNFVAHSMVSLIVPSRADKQGRIGLQIPHLPFETYDVYAVVTDDDWDPSPR